MSMRSPVIDELLARAQQRIFLDVGPHALQTPGWTVMGEFERAEINHDLLVFPWPFPDESVYYVRLFRVAHQIPLPCREHPTDPLLELFDELWRVLCPGGTAWVTSPHASTRDAWGDPTATRLLDEDVFKYASRMGRGKSAVDLACDFNVTHGFTLDFEGGITEMHVSLVKGGPSWQERS